MEEETFEREERELVTSEKKENDSLKGNLISTI